MTQHYHIIVIGAGMTGLTVAAKLREEGHDDLLILEENSDVGGTWIDHNYPGVCADNTIYDYIPKFLHRRFSNVFANDVATRKELLLYMKSVLLRVIGISKIRFNASVVDHDFLMAKGCHVVKVQMSNAKSNSLCDVQISSDLAEYTCKYLFLCTSILLSRKHTRKPELPGEIGLRTPVLHSSSLPPDLDFYAGRNVVIVGWGATTTQLAPSIVSVASSVTIVARTVPLLVPAQSKPVATNPLLRWYYMNVASKLWMITFGFFDNRLSMEWILRRYLSAVIDHTSRSTHNKYVRDAPISCTRVNIDYQDLAGCIRQNRIKLVDCGGKNIRCDDSTLVVGEQRMHTDLLVLATGYQEFNLDFSLKRDGVVQHEKTLNYSFPKSYNSMLYGVPNTFIPCLEPALLNVPGAVVENIMPLFLQVMEFCDTNGLESFIVKDHSHIYEAQSKGNTKGHILESPYCKSLRYADRVFMNDGKLFSFANHAIRMHFFWPSDFEFYTNGGVQTTPRIWTCTVRWLQQLPDALLRSLIYGGVMMYLGTSVVLRKVKVTLIFGAVFAAAAVLTSSFK